MSKNTDMDRLLMSEIKALLADFEITPTMFIDHVVEGEDEAAEDEYQLERGNTYQYFRGARPVPLSKLWRIVYYLKDYQKKIVDEQQREEFSKQVEVLAGKIIEYIMRQSNTSLEFRTKVKKVISEMQDPEIETLFSSLHIFCIPMNVWNFWMCYCCLNDEAQKEIRVLLSDYPLSPVAYGINFYQHRLWESETNIPICAKFKKCWERYNKAEKGKKDRKKFINEAGNLLCNYPYPFPNVAQNFYQRATAPAQMTVDDWSIIIAYGLLQSVVTTESDVIERITIDGKEVAIDRELLKIDKMILKLLSDETNWRYTLNDKRKYAAIPKELVEYYVKAFRESSVVDWL